MCVAGSGDGKIFKKKNEKMKKSILQNLKSARSENGPQKRVLSYFVLSFLYTVRCTYPPCFDFGLLRSSTSSLLRLSALVLLYCTVTSALHQQHSTQSLNINFVTMSTMKAYSGTTRTLLQMRSTLPQNVMRAASFPSLGNLFSPLQYSVRRFTTLGEKERAVEKDFINKEEARKLVELRVQFESEVRLIYTGLMMTIWLQ